MGVLVGSAAGIAIDCAVCVAAMAACTVASMSGVGVPPQAANKSRLIKISDVRQIVAGVFLRFMLFSFPGNMPLY
jgi:hypothetical protein